MGRLFRTLFQPLDLRALPARFPGGKLPGTGCQGRDWSILAPRRQWDLAGLEAPWGTQGHMAR